MRRRALLCLGAAVALSPPTGAGEPPFADVAAERGIDFRHFNGFTGARYDPEIMGAGGGFLDYDGDGDLDLLLIDGAPLPGTPDTRPRRNRLYRNDGRGRFEDVTEAAGVGHTGFGMGLAVGDVDGDGDPDLLVTNYGPDALYRNLGDGTFEEVGERAGVADPRWTTSALFLDADRDGDLDLYVAAYLDFSPAADRPCLLRGHETYCGPDAYPGIPDRLYRNDGSGRFEDVSARAGVGVAVPGKGLGVAAGDFDGDGAPDLYVANDRTANFLFLNRSGAGGVRFSEEALLLGVAYGESARAEAGMGTDFGDYDGDGHLDVVCTNLWAETNALYRNESGRGAIESSWVAGLGASSFPLVGFGVRFLDYDADGDQDLVVVNGHIIDNVAEIQQGAEFAQDDLLYRNDGGAFAEACRPCWPKRVGRGLAVGDFDGDGDPDLLVTNNGDAPLLLENRAPQRGSAIGLRLEGAPPGSNRDAYGARVSWDAGAGRQVREVQGGGSYLSSSDPRLLLAVPRGAAERAVTIRWPGGREETLRLAPGAYHHVVEGLGVVARTAFAARRP